MILALSAYYHPFHAVILDDKTDLIGFYRFRENKPDKNGFYKFPFTKFVDFLLSENFDLYEINSILILGKPLIYFENFLKECFISPGFRKVAFFGNGVSLFFNKIFRIKSDINRVLRHSPLYFFIPAADSCLSAAELMEIEDKSIFSNIKLESGTNLYLKKHEDAFNKNEVCVTLAIIGMCNLFFIASDNDRKKPVEFRSSLENLLNVSGLKWQKAIAKAWDENPFFKTID